MMNLGDPFDNDMSEYEQAIHGERDADARPARCPKCHTKGEVFRRSGGMLVCVPCAEGASDE